jgi:hypothetical protein
VCYSLDGALSTTSTQPAGQAAQGFIVELLARASRLVQRQAAVEQWAASTRCYTTRGGDAMAHDGRWTGQHWGGASTRRVAASAMGIWPTTTCGRGVGEGNWRKRELTGGSQPSATEACVQ